MSGKIYAIWKSSKNAYVCMWLVRGKRGTLAYDFLEYAVHPGMRQRVLVGWQVFDSQCRGASGGRQMRPEPGPLHRHTAGVCSRSSRTGERRRGEWAQRERENFCACSKCMMGRGAGRLQCASALVTRSGEVPLLFRFWP